MENPQNKQSSPQTIIVKKEKSIGISLLLTFLFGPLGMLYSTVIGAVVMFVITIPVAIFTAGLGLILTWPTCMIWGAIAVNNQNKQLTH
ncbi:MAG: hypothetical protein AAF587_00580 [Bacteroidota bacterium]